MKALLPLLAALLFVVSPLAAQETPEPTDWTTEQRCITAPSQPPEGWTYDGVIFTFIPGDGIHARRADMDTPYYVAFDSDSEFGAVRSILAGWEWFAVPEGIVTQLWKFAYAQYYFGDQRFGCTAPHQNMRFILLSGSGICQYVASVHASRWIDNQTLCLMKGHFHCIHDGRLDQVLNRSVRHMRLWISPIIPDSPDGTRAIKIIDQAKGVNALIHLDD